MSTGGMKLVSCCFRLFESLPWHKLVPDQTSDIILTGRATFAQLIISVRQGQLIAATSCIFPKDNRL